MRTMKDSGIAWIDEIPLDWTVKPLKWVVKFGKGLPITKDNLIEQGVPVVSYGQIHSKTNNGTHLQDDLIRFVSETYLKSNPLSLGKKGDIFFADTSEDYAGIGNAVLVDIDTPIFAGYHTVIVRPDDQSYSRYLAYLFLTDAWRSQLCSRASGIKVFSITQGLLKKTTVILPPAEKAVAMTDYLDHKCSQIDTIIARQQEVIEKLKAYKLSVITEAVTKGLNPDVPMKDSGVEWIGEIPGNWTKVKLKNICQFINGDRSSNYPSPNEYVDDGIPFLGADSLCRRYVDITQSKKITKEKYHSMGGAKIREGDILYTLRGSTTGKNAMATFDEGTVASSLMVIRPISIIPEYLLYWLNSEEEFQQRQSYINGSTAPNLSAENVGSFVMFLPSVVEQREIADYLDKKCAEIESTMLKKQMLADQLNNYKKSLIYEVVTGKKEV